MVINMTNKVPDNRGKKYVRKAVDPRQAIFRSYYINPQSHTFMNVLQSGIKAGYTEHYSSSLGSKNVGWFDEMMQDATVNRARMLKKAESALDAAMSYDDDDARMAALKVKAASFVAERVGKDVYSSRQELTDKGGRRLFTNDTKSTADVALELMFIGVAPSE